MANSTIPNLVAVTVPAVTDLFGVRQSGDTRDKKLTVTQLLTLVPAGGDVFKVGTPANNQLGVWTGDGTMEGDTGLQWDGSDIQIAVASGAFRGSDAASGALLNEAASAINPTVLPNRADLDSGIGQNALDQLSLIAGGVEIARASEGVEDQFIISPGAFLGSQLLPALAIGDGDTGFYETFDDVLFLTIGGVNRFLWADAANSLQGAVVGAGSLRNEVSSITNPTLGPRNDDADTGIGSGAADQVSIIGGGVELARFVEAVGIEQALILNNDNTGLPDLAALGDPDTGFNWDIANGLYTVQGGIRQYNWSSTSYFGQNSAGPLMSNVAGSLTVPTFCANRSDLTSGLGGDVGAAALVASSITGLAINAANGNTIPAWNADLTITAFATGGQANATQLDAGHNVISTVATTGDSVKLPPGFSVNSVVFVKNDGVNAADVFPAVGDDLGAGLNTAVSLAAGASASFIATVANATWTPWIVSVGGGGGDVTKVGTPANDQVGVWTGDGTIEGTAALTFDAAALNTTLRFRSAFGSSGAPSHSFTGETNSGLFRQSAGVIMMSIAGTGSWVFRGTSFDSNIADGPRLMFEAATGSNPTLIPRLSDTDTGIGSFSADAVSIIAGNAEGIRVAEAGAVITNTFFGNMVGSGGGGAAPMIKNETPTITNPTLIPNQADPDTGVTRSGVDRLGLVAGGLECMSVRETGAARQVGFYVTAPISLQTGVAVSAAGIHAALVALGLITA